MPDLNDFHAFKSTNGDNNGESNHNGGGFGCGWVVIIIVAVLLISFIADGASWEAIDCLLGFGFIAFLVGRSLFK